MYDLHFEQYVQDGDSYVWQTKPPKEGDILEVTLPIPDEMSTDGLHVYYVADDGTVVDMGATIDAEARTATFTTTHFSTYALANVETPSRVERLGGTYAADTAAAIAGFELAHGMSAADVSVASSIYAFDGVDALAASALAGRNGGVVLLAQSNPDYDEPGVQTETALGFIAEHAPEIGSVHVLGGEAAQTPEFYQQIEALLA